MKRKLQNPLEELTEPEAVKSGVLKCNNLPGLLSNRGVGLNLSFKKNHAVRIVLKIYLCHKLPRKITFFFRSRNYMPYQKFSRQIK